MAAENMKYIDVRVKNKIHDYNSWIANDPVLLDGEIALVTVAAAQKGTVNTVPCVMAKVGDGTHKFSELGWLYARSSDTYEWARQENPPVYEAKDITGISDYIAEYVETEMGISVDTDTQYQLVKVSDYEYKLQSKGKGDGAWADVTGSMIAIPNDTAAIEALQGLVGSKAVATQISEAIAALNLAETYDAKGAADDALEEAKGYTDTKAKEAKDAAEAAQATADKAVVANAAITAGTATKITYDAKGLVTKGETAGIADINGLQAALDNKLEASDVSELEGKVDTLIGNDAGKSARTIANEELAAKLIAADADASLDTLQEIAQWIQDHPGDAAAMNDAITALQNQLNGIDAGTGTVKKYVDDAITALNVGQYALAADLLALAGRVEALEGTDHTHTNKDLLDTYTQTEANLADAVAKKHAHENAAVLDGISAAKVADWDDAVAKEHEHANKAELDLIASGDKAKWDAKQDALEIDGTVSADNKVATESTVSGAVEAAIADLDSSIAATAGSVLSGITMVDGKITEKTEVALHKVATSGNIDDLEQTEGTYLVLDCGSSTVNI